MAKKSLHTKNVGLEKQLAEERIKVGFLLGHLNKLCTAILQVKKINDKQWDENCKLKDKIYDLQADKDGLIEYAKKLRCMLNHSEDEIARLKDTNEMLMQNLQALGLTCQENDQAYYKLVEANAFLAGQVKAYENASKSDAAETV